MLHVDPMRRPSAWEALQHEWVQQQTERVEPAQGTLASTTACAVQPSSDHHAEAQAEMGGGRSRMLATGASPDAEGRGLVPPPPAARKRGT